ncbi:MULTISPECIES: MotA/TolQ/ExbB proton channel family protein [Cetobacterium]|uniref:Transporter, MotA/TolQ/ExbB proton channel family protein n=1 Tax=Cetobacterium somerae ATCC BAA-474 TaxID=1319815 RepID=U7VE82_9FUSO|nr:MULTISPECIES: MotA/TolQ/ExbB proton channel family protein [Cetobacterium]ERT70027.1 transporter, MotA/TolQ/ExbB proton channel family protein [Cetobacterium somerae ATCC BAA-474]MBC2853772.1 MotA/TolQ/ExbB proton channel family protein [Cetobacterium sp. 2G large]MCX3067311.1 MotA/TolQ/ExbB proton channel family protein [Cetobacterium somerae]UPO97898.1 MotA/TolQ/ExbB proton channel family protein [Cetobacterium somerae]WVJ02095.1 MotA/TolQ/ExbB proton channel family protein [Cetobacterium
MYWLVNGGILMYFIVFMSILGLYVIIERAIYFRVNENIDMSRIRPILRSAIEKNDIKGAITTLGNQKSSTAKVIKEVLIYWYKTRSTNVETLEEKAREVALAQVPKLERNMWLLSVVAHTTPLIGLLGTVTGMIKAFQAVSLHGTGDASVLASGISQALLTTAGGLFVAIPSIILYNYFNKKIDDQINDMEKGSAELINYFRK